MLELFELLTATMRAPFWFFIDLFLSPRYQLIYDHLLIETKTIATLCPDCAFTFDENHVHLLAFLCCVPCLIGILFHDVAVWATVVILFGVTFAWTGCLLYPLLLRIAYSPWDRIELEPFAQLHVFFAFLVGLSVLVLLAVMEFPNEVPMRNWVIVSFYVLSIPLLSYLPIHFLSSTGPVSYICTHSVIFPRNCTTPAWYAYALALLRPRHCRTNASVLPFDLCAIIDIHHSRNNRICPATPVFRFFGFQFTSNFRDLTFQLSPYLMPSLYVCLSALCVSLTRMLPRVYRSILMEYERYRISGLLDYLHFHWNRLNIPLTLGTLWCFKLFFVLKSGPRDWPVLPDSQHLSALDVNNSFLKQYTEPPVNQSIASLLLTRVYVGTLVHGSETWLAVFGFATFFATVAVVFVRILQKLLDPSETEINRLLAEPINAPVDIQDWNLIDDPALALDQNDAVAAEMLAGTQWNCAMVFLFLAFQYDLPSLPLMQRICCSLYGLIVIAITCMHPVQAMVRSILLRLDRPGRGSSWMSHIRPLVFCIGLIVSSICIMTYVPEGLAERVLNLSNATATSDSPKPIVVPRFGSSVESLKARQLRIVLCGCQLLLSSIVTVLEYFMYQFSRYNPQWTGLNSSLFWIKLISLVLDYFISLLSFLTVCWLCVYDSIGFCRLLIICCYFYFILYPSAAKAYTWARWHLLFRKRMNDLTAPTEEELSSHGDTCPICYSEMTPTNAKITRCGHFFHTECLIQWMRRQIFCPICHADLLSARVVNRRSTVTQENR